MSHDWAGLQAEEDAIRSSGDVVESEAMKQDDTRRRDESRQGGGNEDE